MWGALSDGRTGLSQSAVYDIYIYRFTCRHSTQSFVKGPVCSGYILFTVLYATLVYMYVQYIQGLCKCRPATEDRALTDVTHVTTAA
jgi:hypothetical protein